MASFLQPSTGAVKKPPDGEGDERQAVGNSPSSSSSCKSTLMHMASPVAGFCKATTAD